MTIRATVFGENVHEQTSQVVRDLYPDGMHSTIADALNVDPSIEASWVTLQMAEHGLTAAHVARTASVKATTSLRRLWSVGGA